MIFLRVLGNFLFPPMMGYFSAKASQDKFENQIYRSALVGSLVGFFVGFMTTVALVTVGLLGSFPLSNSLVGGSLLTYGLSLFIGIPWLFSMIGRGLGFIHGMKHTLSRTYHAPRECIGYVITYQKPNNIALTASIFAVTGDAFVKEFYTYFSSTIDLHQTNFLRKMNEIGCLYKHYRHMNFDLYLSATEESVNLLSELQKIGFIDNSPLSQLHLQFVFADPTSSIGLNIDLMRRHDLLNLENLELLYQQFEDNLFSA